MAKAAAPAAPPIVVTPVTEITGGGAASKEILAGRSESWNDGEPTVVGTEVVEMDAGLGEQSKAEQIMMALRGDGTTEEFGTPAGKVEKVGDEEKPDPKADELPNKSSETEAKPPTRKDILANIGAEKQRRALEAKLAETQAQLKKFTDGSIAEVMRARGLTREQAMEQIVLEGAAGAAPPVDPDPERTALKAKVEELSRIAAKAEDEAVAKVVNEHLEDVDVPLVKAATRIPVPQDNGTAVYKSKHDVIAELAEQLWIEDGKPSPAEKDRRSYIKPAAELLERALNEEFGPLIAAKAGKAEPKFVAPKAPVPAVGKRGGPPVRQPADPYSGMDDYSRRLAIKREYGV
jgi:hypothetical protein